MNLAARTKSDLDLEGQSPQFSHPEVTHGHLGSYNTFSRSGPWIYSQSLACNYGISSHNFDRCRERETRNRVIPERTALTRKKRETRKEEFRGETRHTYRNIRSFTGQFIKFASETGTRGRQKRKKLVRTRRRSELYRRHVKYEYVSVDLYPASPISSCIRAKAAPARHVPLQPKRASILAREQHVARATSPSLSSSHTTTFLRRNLPGGMLAQPTSSVPLWK